MNREDILIRRWLLAGSALAVLGLIGTVLLITVLIATNFNVLNWLE